MTILRRVARNIAGYVVQHASPGWKEWAEGLGRELDFIESDWRALRWAVSSLPVLLDRRPRAILSSADLEIAAQKFASQKRYRVNDVWLANNKDWLVWVGPLLSCLIQLLTEHTRYWSANCVALPGLIILLTHGVLHRKPSSVPDRDDTAGMVQFYKKELERFCNVSFWFYFVGFLSVGLGYSLMVGVIGKLILGLFWTVNLWIIAWKYRNDSRHLQQIERLTGDDVSA
ncbi:hypothetical protein FTW19_02930 [Terriglobus albidus]|uniref:Uncharacterized protein n=1 Tax=Terriglobus albidus TaxID=1592106 RepID=A0A5B9E7D2_9BACT|nr:hypothetical protein [Terriglobus albidus]QEE27055.1 hypothetical protein FTW19_02930 [Terriglobus albidus]